MSDLKPPNDQADQSAKVKSAEKSHSLGDILQSPIQSIFFLIAICTLLCLIPFTKAGYDFTISAESQKPQDYEFPKVNDMWISAISGLVFSFLHLVFKKGVGPMYQGICKEQTNLELRQVKCEKMGAATFRVLYFSSVTAWAYCILKDQVYMPTYLGGSGHFKHWTDGFPYYQHAPQLKEYLLITMGYHASNFVIHFFDARKNDFIEMSLHHIVAIYLFGGCYLYNAWEGGTVLAMLHDIADILVSLTKLLGDTRFQTTTGVIFILTVMPVWFYTRCLVLPYMIYSLWFTQPYLMQEIVMKFFCYLLSCMFILHVYWFYLFIRMTRTFIRKGIADDIQNQTKVQEIKDK